MWRIISNTKVEGTGYIVFGGGFVSLANNCWHFMFKMAATCLFGHLDVCVWLLSNFIYIYYF